MILITRIVEIDIAYIKLSNAHTTGLLFMTVRYLLKMVT